MANKRNSLRRLMGWVVLIFLVALVLVGPEVLPGNSKLYDAIEAGDIQQARTLLAAGANPDGRSRGLDPSDTNRYRYTPLEYALREAEPDIAYLLVDAGADPNQRTFESVPVLIEAANLGMADLVRLLIEKGADVTASSNLGETPLHFGGTVAGQPKAFLDPEIRAMLEAAGAK